MTLKRSLMRSSGPEILEMKCNIRRDLECIPEPGPPLTPLRVPEVLLRRLLQDLSLLLHLAVLLTLQDVHLRVVLQGTARLHGELVHPPVHDVLLQHQGTAALSGVETVGPVHVQDSREVIWVLPP